MEDAIHHGHKQHNRHDDAEYLQQFANTGGHRRVGLVVVNVTEVKRRRLGPGVGAKIALIPRPKLAEVWLSLSRSSLACQCLQL